MCRPLLAASGRSGCIGASDHTHPCSYQKGAYGTCTTGLLSGYRCKELHPVVLALHYLALHCTALPCTALHCTVLPCTALHCIALHCTALHCNALPYSAPLYTAREHSLFVRHDMVYYRRVCVCVCVCVCVRLRASMFCSSDEDAGDLYPQCLPVHLYPNWLSVGSCSLH